MRSIFMNEPGDDLLVEAEGPASVCEIKGLTQLLLLAQEEERQRIAADLHDEIGQCLSAVQLSFGGLKQQLEDRLTNGEREIFAGLARRVAQGIEEVRRICMGLRPPMLDDLGVVSAVEWFCSELHRVLPSVELTQNLRADETAIPPSIKLSIFRILQEACANACKHAEASCLSVVLETDAESVRLEVADDGIGFDVTTERRLGDGFGLASMRERAAMSDGHLTIQSQAGEGTRVLAVWRVEESGARSS
jgi:signal transduction histidine kinase